MTVSNSARFTSRIIKAGAVLEDVKVLLREWDAARSISENLRLVQITNIFGKVSRSRVRDILAIVRTRYCQEEATVVALHRLVREKLSPEIVDRLLYYHAALTEPLIYAFVLECLYPKRQRGDVRVDVEDASRFIRSAVRQRRVEIPWSETTRARVAQGLLATLRDFHVLEGAVRKRFAPVHLPVPAFVYIAYHLRRRVAAGERLIGHPDWRLFLLDDAGVERLFHEAHQQGCLRYEALGQVVRVEFPYATLGEVVDDLVARWAGDAVV